MEWADSVAESVLGKPLAAGEPNPRNVQRAAATLRA